MSKVLLINPPFFRFFGSHNNKAPITLCYLSHFLKKEEIEHNVINLDSTFANKFYSMSRLMDNYHHFKKAIDDDHPLYDELLEIILGHSPTHVVILGADPLVPTKDLGNPLISVNLARRIKEASPSIRTIGMGPYFNLATDKYINNFDCLLIGEPSSTIIDVILHNLTGAITSKPIELDVIPNFSNIIGHPQDTNILFTSFGCLKPCTFCIAGQQYRQMKRNIRHVDIKTIISNLKIMTSKNIYIQDLDFANVSDSRVNELAKRLRDEGLSYSFAIDIRLDGITRKKLESLKELGVVKLKIGIESFSDSTLEEIKKRQTNERYEEKLELIKSFGFKTIAYILITKSFNQNDVDQISKYLNRGLFENIVVNIEGFSDIDNIKYDTQFNPDNLKKWGIAQEAFKALIEIQRKENTFGDIIG